MSPTRICLTKGKYPSLAPFKGDTLVMSWYKKKTHTASKRLDPLLTPSIQGTLIWHLHHRLAVTFTFLVVKAEDLLQRPLQRPSEKVIRSLKLTPLKFTWSCPYLNIVARLEYILAITAGLEKNLSTAFSDWWNKFPTQKLSTMWLCIGRYCRNQWFGFSLPCLDTRRCHQPCDFGDLERISQQRLFFPTTSGTFQVGVLS